MPTCVSWMSPWRAASKPSSTLRGCFGGYAEPVPQNVAKNFYATKSALMVPRLLPPLLPLAGGHDPARCAHNS